MFTFQGPGGCGGVVNMATVPVTRWVWRCGEHGYCTSDQVGVVNTVTVPVTRWVWRCGEHGYCANDQVGVEM